jgi:TusA-related sulfurtransferase
MPELDVRGLPPPEPFENITRTLQTLTGNDTLKVLIHREPFPLYDMLRGAGYTCQTTALANGDFEILIARDSLPGRIA